MGYIDDIFTRSNIKQLQHFLLYGAENLESGPNDYKERMEAAWDSVAEVLKKAFPDQDDYEKVTNRVYGYAAVAQDVHMEIGLQCGAILMVQLLMGHCP